MSTLSVDTIQGKTTANTVQMPSGSLVQFVHKDVGILQLSASATLVSLSTIDITPKFSNSKIFIQVLNHIYIKSLASNNWRGCLIVVKRGDTTLDSDSGKYGE